MQFDANAKPFTTQKFNYAKIATRQVVLPVEKPVNPLPVEPDLDEEVPATAEVKEAKEEPMPPLIEEERKAIETISKNVVWIGERKEDRGCPVRMWADSLAFGILATSGCVCIGCVFWILSG